ncbi:methyltransferase domain-containing protein [Gordonia pseudamarae]|jgi:SAM-dependent methyltransferase|uniref:Methyltransferase domain-containing protein n=1 Tax=Gordonia pseudamarae TaxID=2831662 RepID=A0ABX6IL68_9ACTN|nr:MULTISPECIES: class I SAM-dependent methyltransferase [Gordonia]MBD0020735.1 class I SAM-dependent methyltransferase [Gordonia sp. (in: high G+C Gram-positive bacteria)]QHN27772.1 methyltransferase domain-containing protein [Gordonia pseudamarae]QHN36653.1 methyltransferase domain-containing protein [Gordonia pseudamarae]
MDNRIVLAGYENYVYPKFLTSYAKEPYDHARVYRELRAIEPRRERRLPSVVVDLCCGTGWFARKIARDGTCTGGRIIGVDFSVNAIDVACNRHRDHSSGIPDADVTFYVADVLQPETRTLLSAAPADEVWIIGSLHQVSDKGRLTALVDEILAPDGRVLIQTYRDVPGANAAADIAAMKRFGHSVFAESELAELAGRYGLVVVGERQIGLLYLCVLERDGSHGN